MSLAGRKVLFLLQLASGLHVLWGDLRSLPGFGSRGKFVRPLHQNTVGIRMCCCVRRACSGPWLITACAVPLFWGCLPLSWAWEKTVVSLGSEQSP